MVHQILRKFKIGATEGVKDDSLSKLVGHFGRWQLLAITTICLIKFPTGWIQLEILFLTPKTTFRCVEFSSNKTAVGEVSTCYKDCARYEYDSSPMETSIISEWALICERQWLASFTQMLLQLGILIGSILFGFLADRYGRRYTFLLAVLSLVLLGLGVPFAPDYVTFTVLRFLLGVATAGVMVVSFVLIMETIGPRYRELIGCLYQIPFIFGHLTVPLAAYYFRTWNTYLLVLGATNVVFLAYLFIVQESPRWLLSTGRVDEAADIVTKAAQMNNLPTANIRETLTKASLEMTAQAGAPKLNYAALWCPELRVRTAVSILMWLVTGHTFFGFNQYLGQSSSNPFLSVSVAALVQFPANFASMWLTRQFGRKLTTVGSFAVCGVSIIALGASPDVFWLQLLLSGIGSGVAAVAATCIYIYSSELFPTSIRNMGMGASSMAMRAGSMAAPFVANLSSQATWLPTLQGKLDRLSYTRYSNCSKAKVVKHDKPLLLAHGHQESGVDHQHPI
ncbi:sugar transporter domain-containing protein [Phthorimaea operculella]|nr:sugar transporter domain-containing protein [Phthorimaea operculella]